MEISLDLARKIILDRQLIFPQYHKATVGQVRAIIDRLGYVQIDTITVIQRAHHHTLWSRENSYTPGILNELLKSSQIFEYWAHAASYVPIQDYRFYLPNMKAFQQPKSKWVRDIIHKHGHLQDTVLTRIRKEGPLTASDFKQKNIKTAGGWGNWKPAKKVLELLFWQGKLMISERRNFQRVYDLTENVLPPEIDTSFPSNSEVNCFLILRAVKALGIVSFNDILKHINTRDRSGIETSLKYLVKKNKIVKISIIGLKEEYFTRQELLAESSPELPTKVFILSPFDNLIINRDRLKKIFNFDYRLECYHPEAKRKYGYFALPLLYRDQFIGRMDGTCDRKHKCFIIKSIFLEHSPLEPVQINALATSLIEFAEFNDCNKIDFQPKDQCTLKEILRNKYELE